MANNESMPRNISFSKGVISLLARFHENFYIDPQSEIIAKRLLILVIFIDVFDRLFYFDLFYSGQVLYPKSVFHISFFDFFHDEAIRYAIFIITLISLLIYFIYYSNRLLGLFVFLLIVSLHHANTMVLYGVDDLIRAHLFWVVLFTPIDSSSIHLERQSFCPFRFFFVFQLLSVFFFASLYKIISYYWLNENVVLKVLQGGYFKGPLGDLMIKQPNILEILGKLTMFFQITSLPAFIFFGKNIFVRTVYLLFAFGFYIIGVALGFNLFIFGSVGVCIYFFLIPREF